MIDLKNITHARVIDTQTNKTLKEGIIVGRTTHGANIMSVKNEPPFTDVEGFAEWFPYKSKRLKVVEFTRK
jgi:hypothetical protein